MLEGDLDAYMATVADPGSAFGRAQRSAFENLTDIPLAEYGLEASWASYGDLARAEDRRAHPGAGEVAIPLTIERYRIEGYDREPVRQDLYLTFVKRDGDWAIAADDDLDDLGFMTQRNLWDFSPVQTVGSDSILAVAPRGAPALEAVVSAAERALARVRAFWPDKLWSGRVPVYVPDDPEVLSRIIQATYPVENYVAFSFWTGGVDENPGARIIVNPDGFSGSSNERALSILVHELTHVAAIPSSGSFTPLFVEEGLAQYVQYDGSSSDIAAADASSDPGLPDDDVFFATDQSRILQAYDESLSAVAYMVERWGVPKLIGFYKRLGAVGFEPGTSSFHLDRSMRKSFGVGLQKFARQWASSIGA